MSLDYFGRSTCLLDSINSKNVESVAIQQMVHYFQNMKNEDLYNLISSREYSFIVPGDWGTDQLASFLKFQEFLHKIKNTPLRTQFYLLAIATFNWNGYIRERALDELTKLDKSLSLPFVLMRIVDWALEVQTLARDRLKAIFLDCPINILMEYGKLTNPLFFNYRPHSEMIRKYFLNTYVPRQSTDDIYKCLSSVGDSEKAYLLWKIISDNQFFDPKIFNCGLNSQHPHIRVIVCNRLALFEARKRKGYVAKDPE
jgi:hypothetical protein